MKKHAKALRRYTIGDESTAKDAVTLGMEPGRFESLKLAGLVREATDAEVAEARGEEPPPPPARKPAKR